MTVHSLFVVPQGPPPEAPPTLENWRIDELRAILGQERFDALVRLLIDDCRHRPRVLRASADRRDLVALRAEAHGLAGAAASIGAAALGQAAGAIATASDASAMLPLINALEEAAEATLRAASGLIEAADRVMAAR